MTALRLADITFAYGDRVILEHLSLTVADGEFLVVLGASGGGKTTLLRLIAGLAAPTTGQIFFADEEVRAPSPQRGIVFQDYALFPWYSLRDNVALAVAKSAPRLSRRERRERAAEYLQAVGLGESGAKYPHELSGGMRQRGALARTLALGSPLLLLDEPFGALDPHNRARLQNLLLEIWRAADPRRTVIFVTHDIDEALLLGDRIIALGSNPGRIIGEIKIDAPRPRSREDLITAENFRSWRAAIQACYCRRDDGDVGDGGGI
ncbi:ABC transporter ATP-binding protein [Planctomycetales bacterium]|nr:ABC transporter ATP-binding protein [Planctomycetales bacterium]